MTPVPTSPTPTPLIAVAVSTYQRPGLLQRLVSALEAQSLPGERFEVVIADDGSTDDTFAVLGTLAAASPLTLRPLRLEQNRGPAGGRNAAWRASTAPYVAFTDDDCVPASGWLEAGLRMLRFDDSIGVVQGRTTLPTDAETYPWSDWTVVRDIRQPTPWFEGCNLFLRRDALEAVGGFDESIGWFGEETALGWGVLAAGWDRAFADDAVVRHDLTEHGLDYHLRQRFLEGNIVALARRFPALRRQGFWRPWAIHRINALFALGGAGVVLGAWKRPALLLAAPYLWAIRPLGAKGPKLRLLGERIAVDAAAFAGHVRASIRHRRVVL